MKWFDGLFARLFRLNLNNDNDRNALYLVLEVFWASILGSAGTFNAAFAIRLGAQNVTIGLLTSIPALFAVLISIPAGQFLQRRARRAPWVMGALAAYRSGFLIAAIVPWLHPAGIPQGLLLVLILVSISAPAHFFNVGWIPLLADVVPERRRAAVFAARNIVNNITLSVFGFLFGQWLTRIVFPTNYQTMYMIGFVTSMLSMYCLIKLKVPNSIPIKTTELKALKARSLQAQVRAFRGAMDGYPEFLRITRNTLLHGLGLWLASPLYVLYYVKVLHASDAWLGINAMVASMATILGFTSWRWIMARWGEPNTLKRTIVLLGFYPALIGLMPSLTPILLLSALNGLVAPGVNLSHFNTLLKTMPADSRPSYTAMYMTIMNIGAFISPLIGVAVANQVGLGPMLVVSGLISVVGSSSFWWSPVSRPEDAAAQPLAVEAAAELAPVAALAEANVQVEETTTD